MRRSILLTGIALGVTALFTAWAVPSKAEKLKDHLDRVREIAFFQKSYEIASSFPSYQSRKTSDHRVIIQLAHEYKTLNDKSKHLDGLLTGELKDEAHKLGMSPQDYELQLAEIRTDAELEAVEAFKQAEPTVVIAQLDQASSDIFTE